MTVNQNLNFKKALKWIGSLAQLGMQHERLEQDTIL